MLFSHFAIYKMSRVRQSSVSALVKLIPTQTTESANSLASTFIQLTEICYVHIQ